MNCENYDPGFPDQPVADRYLPMWASLPAFRSKPAFIWAKDGPTKTYSTLTYSELNDSAQYISSNLLLRLERRDTVVVLCSPGLDLVKVLFGCQRAGLLSVPISPPDPSFKNNNFHHLVRVISQTGPKAAIAHKDYITKVQTYLSSSSSSSNPKLTHLLGSLKWLSTEELEPDNGPVMGSSKSSSYNGCGPDDVYLIQYTSGATGIPKPVLVTSGSAVHNVRVARKCYDLHPSSVIVSWLPQYHDCGLQFLLLSIISGATCVLTSPTEFVTRPRIWLELISVFGGSCTPVPSFTLPLVVKRGCVGKERTRSDLNLESLKNLILINEPIYKSSVEEFVEAFRVFGLNPSCIAPSYGLAENCTFVSTAWRSTTASGNYKYSLVDLFPSYNKLLPSARLASNSGSEDSYNEEEEMKIVVVNEETCELVEDGTEGEIWISSPSNCSGYLGHPNLTREVFQARVSNSVTKCFVRTGDRGVIKGEERFLYVLGRCSDVIKKPNGKGEAHPHYIETVAYSSCPKYIRGGCLVAFKTGDGVIAVVAEVQRKEAEEVHVLKEICEGIRTSVRREINGVDIGLVVLVKGGSVPKTTSGKVMRWAARGMLERGELDLGKVVLMEVRFGVDDEAAPFWLDGGGGGRRKKVAAVVGGDHEDQVPISLSSRDRHPTRPPLMSFL